MPKTTLAKTLTPAYDKLEDRIRLCINYQDINSRIDLMITRAFIIDLLSTMSDYLDQRYHDATNHTSLDAYKEQLQKLFQKESNTQESSKKVDELSATNMTDLNLYKINEELLVTVNFGYESNTKKTVLTFITKEKNQVILQADVNVLINLINSELKENISG